MEEQQEKNKSIPKRAEIPEKYKWRLEDLYAGQEQWENDFAYIKTLMEKMGEYRGNLADSPDNLRQCLQLYEHLMEKSDKLYAYAHMRLDENTMDMAYQALKDRAASLLTEVSSATAYLVPEILAIPEEKLTGMLNDKGGLSRYKRFLAEIMRQKPHILSASEEQILAQAGEVTQGPYNIFRMLNDADLRFPTIRDENGEEVEVTKGRFIPLMESSDRRVRRDAFQALYSTYHKQRNTLAATLNASIKKDVFYARVRKYRSALEAALDDENIPLEVYDNLLHTIHDHLEPMYKYVRLRKQALGVDELHMYDLYTPLVKESKTKIPYQEALEIVEKGLAPLGEDYQAKLRIGFTEGWIDVFENEGKTGGAYSNGIYGAHPYVLLNYQSNLDGVFTIAHEMGHALHSYYSNREQPYIDSQYKIFVAEVASTLNEILLMNYLLKNTGDPQMKASLLNNYLEQFRTTVYRQTMFAEFEKITHEKVESGEPLTAELLSTIYHDLNVKYYGPEVVVDPEIRMEWARIPHFYRAFYVYKYATGYAAAIALAEQILAEGKPAVERYLRFLQSGNSDSPVNLLKNAGVDMTSPQPLVNAIKVFRRILGELETLL